MSTPKWLEEEPTLTGEHEAIREVDYNPFHYRPMSRKNRRGTNFIFLVVFLLFIVGGFALTLSMRDSMQEDNGEGEVKYVIVENNEPLPANTLSPLFTPQVQFWKDDILRWSKEYQLDPNLVATVMQIESCGDPNAGSTAGAQGLFQVMPFHFAEGEVMQDPDNNANRGLNYLSEGLRKAEGHVGLALAGYNGGHGVIAWGWARWATETRRYHYWGTGIYYDAITGKASSERLQEWLDAGGSYLCAQAAERQRSLTPRNTNNNG